MMNDDRLLGSTRQISEEMRASWQQADRRERRRRLAWRLVSALVLIVAAIVLRVLA